MKKLNLFPQASRVKLQPFVLLIHRTNLAKWHSEDYPSWCHLPAAIPINHVAQKRSSRAACAGKASRTEGKSPSCLNPWTPKGLSEHVLATAYSEIPNLPQHHHALGSFLLGQTKPHLLNWRQVTAFWRKRIPQGRKETPQGLTSSGKSKLATFSYVKPKPPYHKAEILKIAPLQYQMAGLFQSIILIAGPWPTCQTSFCDGCKKLSRFSGWKKELEKFKPEHIFCSEGNSSSTLSYYRSEQFFYQLQVFKSRLDVKQEPILRLGVFLEQWAMGLRVAFSKWTSTVHFLQKTRPAHQGGHLYP